MADNSLDTFNNFRAVNQTTGESKQFGIRYHAVAKAISYLNAGHEAVAESRKDAESPWESVEKDKSELERMFALDQAARAAKGKAAPKPRQTQDPMRKLSNAAATLSGRSSVSAGERDALLELINAACLQVGIDQHAHAGKK